VLADAIETYLAVRRAAGFVLKCEAFQLKSFAAFAEASGADHVVSDLAIEWAGAAPSFAQRARRLGTIIRFARYARVEDARHQVPSPIFGAEKPPRRAPYLLTMDQIRQLITVTSQQGYRTLRRATYSTLFALLACTGLRISEAIRLRFRDITPDGLIIRATKFRKNRLVPLHDSARVGLERYLRQRRPYAPLDDHVFVSLRRKPLLPSDVETAFRTAVIRMGLPQGRSRTRPTPHSLRHAFAVRALQTCPSGRDAIGRHMVALSTYLGHSNVAHTYWYLEAVPDLMRDIAEQAEGFVTGERS
jgi:integrase